MTMLSSMLGNGGTRHFSIASKNASGRFGRPSHRFERYDPQGSLLGHMDRVTVLQVTIDSQGYLKDLEIIDHSGVGYLDDEATRTFRAAAPFLYPPQEIVQ